MHTAIRYLRRNPGFAVTVVLLLGFGIGANTALFTLFRAILQRPIPGVKDSGELVRVRRVQNGRAQGNQSYPDYTDFRDGSRTVTGLIAERLVPIRLAGSPARVVSGAIVTGNYFQSLGVTAAYGRVLGPEDDRQAAAVAVVSEAFWQRELKGEPRAIGTVLDMNGYPFTIAGVAAAPFAGVEFGEHTEIWMPMSMVRHAMTRSRDFPFLTARNAGWLTWYGRLRPAAALREAQREWNTIAAQLEKAYPRTNAGRTFELHRNAATAPNNRAEIASLLGLLFAAVCLILAIACGNVANLMLARAAGQAREMAIRLAQGASRQALVRQVLAESLMLAGASGALGLLLSPWIVGLLGTVWRQEIPRAAGFDWRVFVFAAGASLACVVVCGLAPAWASSSIGVAAAMKQSSAQAGRGRGRVQRAFAVAQVSLSAALVIASGLVLGSMRRIAAIEPGFRADGVVMAAMDLSLLGLSPEQGTELFQRLTRQVAAMPGVRSVSLGKSSPAVDWSDRVELGGFSVDCNIVAPGYFRTLGISLVAGRDFTEADRGDAAQVAIVSRSLAAKLWGAENAVGRQVRVRERVMEVIGVAADSRYRSVLNTPSPLLYMPLWQNYDSIARLMVAVDGPAGELKQRLRREVERIRPDLPVRAVNTMREQIEQSLWQRRAAGTVLSFFAALALGLACTGIYGVVAYLAAQRTREIGIRMALGAARVNIVRDVTGQAVRMTLAGLAIAVPLALWARPLLAGFVYGGGSAEAVTFGGVAVLFVAVGLVAGIGPAHRAASVDPAICLRAE